MKKSEYEKYIIPSEFAALYDEWKAKGKPKGSDATYKKIWDGAENAVKACIGSLQNRYGCRYQNYEDKVLYSTCKVMEKLFKLEEAPQNIVNLSYLYVVGVCCSKKAIEEDKNNQFYERVMSCDRETEDGTPFIEMFSTDNY